MSVNLSECIVAVCRAAQRKRQSGMAPITLFWFTGHRNALHGSPGGARLVLSQITINSKSGDYPPINNVQADLEIGKQCFESKGEEYCSSDGGVYMDVGVRLTFTGKIRIAADFIGELYVHMGFQKPSAFETVIDLSFEDGLLVSTEDRSEDAAKIRGKFKEEYYGQGKIPEDAVRKAFSLEMEPLQ